MLLKRIIDETFGDYKEASMLLVTPNCGWKCEGCQNTHLELLPTKEYSNSNIVERFTKNPLTSAIIIGGLEPMDDTESLSSFLSFIIAKRLDIMIVVYTGYTIEELQDDIYKSEILYLLEAHENSILKYGRYIPNDEGYFNEDLGIHLASKNQKTITWEKKF